MVGTILFRFRSQILVESAAINFGIFTGKPPVSGSSTVAAAAIQLGRTPPSLPVRPHFLVPDLESSSELSGEQLVNNESRPCTGRVDDIRQFISFSLYADEESEKNAEANDGDAAAEPVAVVTPGVLDKTSALVNKDEEDYGEDDKEEDDE
jgi:hypothetical protein